MILNFGKDKKTFCTSRKSWKHQKYSVLCYKTFRNSENCNHPPRIVMVFYQAA
jgi:hypothetical protein